MTISAIIVCVLLTIIIAAIGIYFCVECHDSGETGHGILALVIGIIPILNPGKEL